MTARRERRRRRGFGRILLGDPYRKLLAFALALGLWYYLDYQVSTDHVIELDLPMVSSQATRERRENLALPQLPSSFAIAGYQAAGKTEKIEKVRLYFRGSKAKVDELKTSYRFGLATRDVSSGTRELEFTMADLTGRDEYLAMLSRIEPPRIRMLLEEVVERTVSPTPDRMRVVFRPSTLGDGLRLSKGQARLTPQTATLLMPQRATVPKDFDVIVENSGIGPEEIRGRLQLRAESSQSGIEFREPVSVVIPVQPRGEVYQLNLGVIVDDRRLPEDRRGKLGAKAGVVPASVFVYGDARMRWFLPSTDEEIAAFAAENLRLLVVLDENDVEGSTPRATLLVYLDDEKDKRQIRLHQEVVIDLVRKP